MSSEVLKTRLAQIEVKPGRPVENAERMLDHIRSARQDGVGLIIFSEMCIPGYLLGDEWEHEAFLRECEACGEDVLKASEGITVVFGNVGVDWQRRNEDGRVRKYNALFTADNGRFVGPSGSRYDFVVKTLLPNYREFDDSRHFFDLRKLAAEEGKALKDLSGPVPTSRGLLGCVICEDAWHTDYGHSPLEMIASDDVPLYINISSSPFTLNKNHKRNRVFTEWVRKLNRPLAYVNNVGIQNNGKTVFTFDGSSCIYDTTGHAVVCDRKFEEGTLTCDIPLKGTVSFAAPVEFRDDDISDIHAAISYGTRKFMDLCGVKKVTVGVSGGIDSAVAAALYSEIMDPEDLLLVNMPGQYTSGTTRSLAAQLADNIGCYYTDIPIADSVAITSAQIDGLEISRADGKGSRKLELSGFMLENVQARDRSSRILSAAASAFGGVFTCNSNKSEATVGYTTLYGDLCGYLANLADLWKTDVYELARYMNDTVFGRELIPLGSIKIVPSAELSSAQDVDKGQGDPLIYAYHDKLFRSWVERWNRTTIEEILDWYSEGCLENEIGYDGKVSELFGSAADFISDLERWWSLYQGMGLAKRIQAPPILAVKKRAFGFDHRESQMGTRYTRTYLTLKEQLLGR